MLPPPPGQRAMSAAQERACCPASLRRPSSAGPSRPVPSRSPLSRPATERGRRKRARVSAGGWDTAGSTVKRRRSPPARRCRGLAPLRRAGELSPASSTSPILGHRHPHHHPDLASPAGALVKAAVQPRRRRSRRGDLDDRRPRHMLGQTLDQVARSTMRPNSLRPTRWPCARRPGEDPHPRPWPTVALLPEPVRARGAEGRGARRQHRSPPPPQVEAFPRRPDRACRDECRRQGNGGHRRQAGRLQPAGRQGGRHAPSANGTSFQLAGARTGSSAPSAPTPPRRAQ